VAPEFAAQRDHQPGRRVVPLRGGRERGQCKAIQAYIRVEFSKAAEYRLADTDVRRSARGRYEPAGRQLGYNNFAGRGRSRVRRATPKRVTLLDAHAPDVKTNRYVRDRSTASGRDICVSLGPEGYQRRWGSVRK